MRGSKMFCEIDGRKVEVVLANGEPYHIGSARGAHLVKVVLATGQTIKVSSTKLSIRLDPSNADIVGTIPPQLNWGAPVKV